MHISTSFLKEKLSSKHEVLYIQSKEASIDCESAAYLGYKLGLSQSVYENIFTEIHLPDRNVGSWGAWGALSKTQFFLLKIF